AEQLRRALNQKNQAEMVMDYRERFYQGALARGVAPEAIEKTWKMIMSFAGYSFCKPHSASYAQLSLECAYLKAHYPAEFMAAVISNEGGYYPTLAYLSEARRMGFDLLNPDINKSDWKYAACTGALRVGFMQIAGLKHSLVRQIIAERQSHGRFQSLQDFCSRLSPEKEQVALLIKAGCFDSLSQGRTRPGLLWQAYAQGTNRFNRVPNPDEYSELEKLRYEIETFGLLLSRHPLELYRAAAAGIDAIRADEMNHYVGRKIHLLGWLISDKLTQTKTGEPMEFVTFEDESSLYEATLFPGAYQRFYSLLIPNRPFLLEGRVDDHLGCVTLKLQKIARLDRLAGS
ncbi:MAG TPA: hypothetical protein VE131_14000, partial [Terriglobales bacterium]|nr:hypothetical protein [Terriglobales bacterium]